MVEFHVLDRRFKQLEPVTETAYHRGKKNILLSIREAAVVEQLAKFENKVVSGFYSLHAQAIARSLGETQKVLV